jgi:hypothetical protein
MPGDVLYSIYLLVEELRLDMSSIGCTDVFETLYSATICNTGWKPLPNTSILIPPLVPCNPRLLPSYSATVGTCYVVSFAFGIP